MASFGGTGQITGDSSFSFAVGDFPLSLSSSYSDVTTSSVSAYTYSTVGWASGPTIYCKFLFPDVSSSGEVLRHQLTFRKNVLYNSRLVFDCSTNTLDLVGVGSGSNNVLDNVDYTFIYSGSDIVGFYFSAYLNSSLDSFGVTTAFSSPSSSGTISRTFSSYDDFIISTEPIVTASPTLSVTATDITSTSAQLNFTAENLDSAKQYQIRMEEIANPSNSDIIATFSGSETFSDSGVVGPLTPNFTYNSRFTLIEDGVDTSATVDLSFTTLPKVYNPQISASQFSVTSNTFTSTVTLSDLDPTHTYKPFWALYAKSDMTEVISSGYAAEIGEVTGVENYTGYSRVVNLSPSTAYLINWTLLDVTDDKIVPSVSNVEFTTLGDGSGGGSGSSDDSPGILLMILNKVSAILDTLSGGQSEGILASINEKLDALVETLANPAEKAVEESFQETTQYVGETVFGDESDLKLSLGDVGDMASVASTGKNLLAVPNTGVGDFLGLFSSEYHLGWFSQDTKDALTSVDSVSVVSYSLENTLSKEETAWEKHQREYYAFFGLEG